MEENSIKQQENSIPGIPFTKDDPRINKEGRPKETEEQKVIKKARKQLIEEYKDALAEALPLINPVLVAKAISGDVPAIKEVHDRVMNKATQPINGGEDEEGKPIPFLNFIK